MTDITDQQRREVAERLRIKNKPAPHADREFMNVFEDFVADTTGIWDYREEDATPEGFNAYCDLLADLIDRPTCRAVPCGGGMFACERCGAEAWADAESVTRYCPECGAGVVA